MQEALCRRLLAGLPEVQARVAAMRAGGGATPCATAVQQEAASVAEYQRGVSQWNFDVRALKAQVRLCSGAGQRLVRLAQCFGGTEIGDLLRMRRRRMWPAAPWCKRPNGAYLPCCQGPL